MRAKPWDTIIIGGSPAGLSAALVLGRCCRKYWYATQGRLVIGRRMKCGDF